MRRYLKKILYAMIIIACLAFAGNLYYKEYIRTQNVFDQMYYTRIRTSYDWWGGLYGGGGNKADSFSHMPQIKRTSRDKESSNTEMGYFSNPYIDKYLREGESLVVVCDRNDMTVEIIAVKRFNEFLIIYRYNYDVIRKTFQEKLECEYGELYLGKSNIESYKEYTEDLQEILLIIEGFGLTKEDLLEYKKYFLYDKLLTDWLSANESRFSIDNWGKVEFIEVLPLEGRQH